MQNAHTDVAAPPMPIWAKVLSWSGSVALAAALMFGHGSSWTKGACCGLVLSFVFALIWIGTVVRFARGEPIPSLLKKPLIEKAPVNSWLDKRGGILLQITIILAASIGITILA